MVTRCEDLTPREREVLRMLSEDFTREQIATKLDVSISTINHMLSNSQEDNRSIYHKINVTSQKGAINWYNLHCKQSDGVTSTSPLVDIQFFDFFYHYEDSFSSSIRLCGAANEFFPASTIHIIPDITPFRLPVKLSLVREDFIARLKEKATKQGTMFFDGPNTRLINYHVSPHDSTEQKHLELVLGPIGWYDYSVCKLAVSETIKYRTLKEFQEYVDLEEVAYSRNITSNKIGNILCTATTLVTSDRFVLYCQRGSQVSTEPHKLTSSIAENIHQRFDHSLESQLPNELPAPFRTVIRGIDEEASPEIAQYVRSRPHLIFLLGLDFDLLSIQPDLLFMVYLPFSYSEIQKYCRQYPGKDFIEGNLQAISLDESEQIDTVLSDPNWLPGGKSSLIRTIEFLEAVQRANPDLSFEEVMERVKNKNI